MRTLQKIELLLLCVVLFGGGVFYALRTESATRRYELLPLEKLPGVSQEVLAAQGSTVRIVTPLVYFPDSGTAMFEVTILDTRMFSGERDYAFQGDTDLLRNFVREIQFVRAKGTPGLVADSEEIGRGAGEAVNSLVGGIWSVFRHPIDTITKTWGGIAGLANYAKLVAEKRADPREDAAMFARAFYVDTCSAVADENGFSYLETQTPEAKLLTQRLAIPRISGDVGTQILSIFLPVGVLRATRGAEIAEAVADASKLAEITQVEKGADELAALGKAFGHGEEAANALARLAKFERAETALKAVDNVSWLVDPENLRTLTQRGVLNRRLHKLLYHLHEAETNGDNIASVLNEAMEKAAKRNPNAVPFLDPEIERSQILESYQQAKVWGIFDDPTNLERMRHERAPVIKIGPDAGQPVDVDHIIQFSRAPELDNRFGNLRYMTQSANRARGNRVDQALMDKLHEYQQRGTFSQQRSDAILSYGLN